MPLKECVARLNISGRQGRQGLRPHRHRFHVPFKRLGLLKNVLCGILVVCLGLGDIVGLPVDALRLGESVVMRRPWPCKLCRWSMTIV